MGSTSNPPADVFVTLHNSLVMAGPSSTDPTQWTLPSTDGLSGTDLADAVAEVLDTLAEPDEPLRIGDKTLPVVRVPTAAWPADSPNRQWFGPEAIRELTWHPHVAHYIDALAQYLLDGDPVPSTTVTGAVRIGGTVRRPTGPWTPAVHAGLRHLTNFGLDAVPKVLGTDARGREVISHLPGRRVDMPGQFLNDVQLAEAASWTSRFHEALRGFNHPGPFRTQAPAGATILGHNNVGQHNLCFAGNRLVGVTDWDLFGPTTVPRELAWLAWTAVPLGGVIPAGAAARRVHVIASTYDLDVSAVLDAVRPRIEDDLLRSAHVDASTDTSTTAATERAVERLDVFTEELPEMYATLRRTLNRR